MAYIAPNRWSHGDYPTAANMNKYKTGLDDIYARIGTVGINPTVCFRKSGVESFWLMHQQRWLLYRGEGKIVDPAGAGEDVALSGAGAEWFSYDLLQVEWIYPGKLYHVDDLDACFEDYEAL